ncbi:Bug family tripartite tricarboxylate transporter substrate binding protein [Humitalea sp. 24SJ18S-53]|uniref:Bug family tripartite tricarboxylate transporter substrate binding protein n=1 Tax=Humitalea sp. 24SJ18S-53 TaxID=3422307 RepID=UPI003D67F0D6
MIRRRALPLLGASILAAPALAQAPWPNRPIRYVVPFPPGGASDIIGRLMAQALSEGLGVPVVVDNRSGAGGTIGTAFVAQSAPDGYTVMLGSGSSHLGGPLLFANPGYEGVDDFTAIASFSGSTSLMACTPGLPANNVQEFIAYCRANPGRVNFGSAGAGGSNHLNGVLFMMRTGVEMVHVPYRGSAPALADLMSGQIQVVFDTLPGIIGTARSGAVRALGVTTATRWPFANDIPTIQEQGVPDFDMVSWGGLMGPANIPAPIVARMNAIITAALADPAMITRMASAGVIPLVMTQPAFHTYLREQRTRIAEIVRASGVKPEGA